MQSYAIPASASAVMARYGNIIFLDRPVHDGDLFSRRHPAMTRLNRAKIFAPFAALVGDEDVVAVERLIGHRRDLPVEPEVANGRGHGHIGEGLRGEPGGLVHFKKLG